MSLRVMTVGMVPETVDYSHFPDLNAAKVRAGLAVMEQQLKGAGYAVHLCLVENDDAAMAKVESDLAGFSPDVVIIGAGLRNSPHLFALFETVLDCVHRKAPSASIGFNTRPDDTLDAVLRAAARRAP